jgi:hypothetical protein
VWGVADDIRRSLVFRRVLVLIDVHKKLGDSRCEILRDAIFFLLLWCRSLFRLGAKVFFLSLGKDLWRIDTRWNPSLGHVFWRWPRNVVCADFNIVHKHVCEVHSSGELVRIPHLPIHNEFEMVSAWREL